MCLTIVAFKVTGKLHETGEECVVIPVLLIRRTV